MKYSVRRKVYHNLDMHECYSKAVSDCSIDKSLLKCLVVNDSVNNVYLMTSLIYVTLIVVAIIFITLVFRSHWRNRDYRKVK